MDEDVWIIEGEYSEMKDPFICSEEASLPESARRYSWQEVPKPQTEAFEQVPLLSEDEQKF